ncbi:MAG: DNA polymerase III subunit epsilon [Pseudomonadota bacterium]|nr:DNA polymerase III subunit epsilon [Pseudomonadota bacterium]
MRQIVLDTETTGLSVDEGHRIIEIGCVELIDRRLTGRSFHQYLNPDREIDAGAIEVHGITLEQLVDAPRFGEVAEALLDFLGDADLIIHNAAFDLGFLNAELARCRQGIEALERRLDVIDTLVMARQRHPGQRNSLDALCKRYQIDNSQRQLHGALLDAQILAEVYLAMTGGQVVLSLEGQSMAVDALNRESGPVTLHRPEQGRWVVTVLDEQELAAHERMLADLDKASAGRCLWRQLESTPAD